MLVQWTKSLFFGLFVFSCWLGESCVKSLAVTIPSMGKQKWKIPYSLCSHTGGLITNTVDKKVYTPGAFYGVHMSAKLACGVDRKWIYDHEWIRDLVKWGVAHCPSDHIGWGQGMAEGPGAGKEHQGARQRPGTQWGWDQNFCSCPQWERGGALELPLP